MSKQIAINLKSATAEILLDIAKIIDDTYFGFARPGMVVKYGIEDARRILNRKEWRVIQSKLQEIKNRDFIHAKKIEEKYEIELLNEGCIQILQLQIQQANPLPDGTYCLIAFDIPESCRKFRNRIRKLLSKLGFSLLQRSVWISSQDVASKITTLFKCRGIKNDWFKIFTVKEA